MYGLGVSSVQSNCHQRYFLTVTVMSDLCLFLKYFFLRSRSNISIMNKLRNALTTYPARQLQKLSHAALLDQIMFYEGSSPQLSIIKFISGHISCSDFTIPSPASQLLNRLVLRRSKKRIDKTF